MNFSRFLLTLITTTAVNNTASAGSLELQPTGERGEASDLQLQTVEDVRRKSRRGRSLTTAQIVDQSGVPMQFSALLTQDGEMVMTLDDGFDRQFSIQLDGSRFRVESTSDGVSRQHDWQRPRGDMAKVIAYNGPDADYVDAGEAFDQMPMYYLAMDAAEEALASDLTPYLDDVRVAASVLSGWIGSMETSDQSMSSTSLERGTMTEADLMDDEGGEYGECIIPDAAAPKAGRLSISVPGATVSMVAAQSNLNANCIKDNCISGDASAARKEKATRGKDASCPTVDTELGDEEPYSYTASIEFKANAGTGDCTNGVLDTANSGSVEISGSGFSAEIEAASDVGNGVSTKAELSGFVAICMESDPVWPDVTNVVASGTATAKVN